MKIVATTFTGLEQVLKKEIENLGGKNIKVHKRAVSYYGDKTLLYKSNLLLRTAIRVLMPLTDFIAEDADTLYQKVFEIDWTKIFDVDKTFAVEAVTYSNTFKHSGFVALKTKDAIVDRFREIYGYRPDVDNKQPHVKINVHVRDTFFNISLDSSGEPLFKRGYRVEQTVAPMNEVLAAGLIQLSNWDMQTDFVDFMCGSGTIPIEAALLATNTPSQFKRTYFGFKHWKNYDKSLWDNLKDYYVNQINKDIKPIIFGSDKDREAIAIARKNAESANVDDVVKFRVMPMQKLDLPENKKHIIINPPYGMRITGNMKDLYSKIGYILKRRFRKSTAWVFSNNPRLLTYIGLKPGKKYIIKTGALEGHFYKYNIF